jgi:ABC-type Mn2+/Zn2+ transport system ATPase subunit
VHVVTAELSDVRFRYGAEPILVDVDLTLCVGEFTVLAGANGSGKSTLLKLMVGLLRADAGAIRVLDGSPADPRVRRRVGYAPQGLRLATALPRKHARLSRAGRGPGLATIYRTLQALVQAGFARTFPAGEGEISYSCATRATTTTRSASGAAGS